MWRVLWCFDKGKHHILSLYFCEGDSRSLYSKLNEQICLLFLPLLGIICGCNENVYQWNLQSVLPCCTPRGFCQFHPAGRGEHPWYITPTGLKKQNSEMLLGIVVSLKSILPPFPKSGVCLLKLVTGRRVWSNLSPVWTRHCCQACRPRQPSIKHLLVGKDIKCLGSSLLQKQVKFCALFWCLSVDWQSAVT